MTCLPSMFQLCGDLPSMFQLCGDLAVCRPCFSCVVTCRPCFSCVVTCRPCFSCVVTCLPSVFQLCGDLSSVRADIVAFIQTHAHEHVLTGRAIARVLHGIDSPCFPAEVWGRQRRFWRAHLPVDFNIVRKLADRELVSFR